MFGEYLSNTNESATVSKTKIFCQRPKCMAPAVSLAHHSLEILDARNGEIFMRQLSFCRRIVTRDCEGLILWRKRLRRYHVT